MPSGPVPAHSSGEMLKLFSGSLSLSAGTFFIAEGESVTGPMRPGLKVGVMLDGRQMLELDDRPPVMIEGPALLVAANGGEHIQQRTGLAGGAVRCALMQFELDFVAQEFGAELSRLLLVSGPDDAGLWVRPASAELRSLALQMAECRVADSLRSFYLAGKALELGALALNEIIGERPVRPAKLDARTRDQIQAVREILEESVQDPPSLSELARRTGLNPSKLTSAFRAQFGTSVFGYLQEYRLQQAHAMIASGEASVAVAAFRVGYSPAHFSSAFRKRFGIPPSALR